MAKAYIPEDVGAGWWRDIPGYGGRYLNCCENCGQAVDWPG